MFGAEDIALRARCLRSCLSSAHLTNSALIQSRWSISSQILCPHPRLSVSRCV